MSLLPLLKRCLLPSLRRFGSASTGNRILLAGLNAAEKT